MVNQVPETSNRCNGNVEGFVCQENSAMALPLGNAGHFYTIILLKCNIHMSM